MAAAGGSGPIPPALLEGRSGPGGTAPEVTPFHTNLTAESVAR